MPVEVSAVIKPLGKFPVVEATDVQMPDGSRLDELSVSYPIQTEGTKLKPETYYAFGEVSSLSLVLEEPDDGKVHEFTFEFIPADDFTDLAITPAPRWVSEPVLEPGMICQVSILRNVGVAVSA